MKWQLHYIRVGNKISRKKKISFVALETEIREKDVQFSEKTNETRTVASTWKFGRIRREKNLSQRR